MEVKTISSNYIVQRMLANHSFDSTGWINDSKDWIAQAVRFIGKHAGFETRICTNVFVENYKTCYPQGMEGLLAIMRNGLLLPLGSNLAGVKINREMSSVNIMDNETQLELNKLQQQKEELISMYAITPTDEIANQINEVAHKIDSIEKYVSAYNQYQVGRGLTLRKADYYNTHISHIQTSFESDYIDIVYTGFPVDEDGFLKVLDNEYYIQAIEWYIVLVMIQKGYKHPIFDYLTAYTMFWGGGKLEPMGWRARAANNVRIQSIQDAERFTRMWEQARFRRDLPIQLFERTEQLTGTIY
jgi:hypothetical protein